MEALLRGASFLKKGLLGGVGEVKAGLPNIMYLLNVG